MNSDLADMIETSFGSIWTLELLLVLYREPQRLWSAEELVGELRSSEGIVGRGIDELTAAGLASVEIGGGVRYSPSSPEQGVLVGQLEEDYRKTPAAIRRLILQPSPEKLRSFADAFRLKKS